jgi:biopolymer transport protein TolR
LLVIFMITAPLLTQGVKVDLPRADANPMDEDAKRPLVVSVDKEGVFHITYDDDRTQSVEDEELVRQASAILATNPGIPVLVKGDREVDYGRVIQAMVLLQEAGAPGIGLLTDPSE